MPYAVFDSHGLVLSLHRHDPGVGEWVEADDPAVRRFVGLDGPAGEGQPAHAAAVSASTDFSQLDQSFIRVLEDVIEALTERNVINITDLPEMAQAKLFDRRSFRDRTPKSALQLFHHARGTESVI